MKRAKMKKVKKACVDTSAVINGRVTLLIKAKKLDNSELIIPELVLGELQAQRAAVLQELEEGEPEPLPEAWTDRANSASGTMMYYSFVTLTTLGYGDIYPVRDGARIMAMLEATLGQLYLVILVARLVGLYTSQESERRKKATPT